jgi:hypothetical protein
MRSTHHEVGREHRVHVVAGIERDPQEGRLGEQGLVRLDVVVDLVLGLEMWHEVLAAGDLLAVGQRAPDVVLEGGGLGRGAREVDALLDLDLDGGFRAGGSEGLEEVGYGVDGGGAVEGFDERLLVVEVGGYDLDALRGEGFGARAVGVAGRAADLVCALLKGGGDDGPALGSGCADNSEKL